MIRVRNWDDVFFGCLLVVVGLGGLFAAGDLPIGTLLRMGPGWMPNALCWLLLVFGGSLIGRGLLFGEVALDGLALRPMSFVLGAVAFFALTVEHVGLPVAVSGTVLLAALADEESRVLESIGLAIFLAAGTSLLFVKGLGLSIPIWPGVLN